MTQTDDRFRHYQESFPSDWFLRTYFSPVRNLLQGHNYWHMNIDVHERLRTVFDNVLRRNAARILKAQLEKHNLTEPVYVFRHYQPEPWVTNALMFRKVQLPTSPHGTKILCEEFIINCKSDAWPQSPWKQWRATCDSIWLEIIPKAVLEGKHHSNSLRDLMYEPDV